MPSPRWIVPLLALAVACGTGTETSDRRPDGPPSPSSTPVSVALKDRVEAVVRTPGNPDWLASGYGALWVAEEDGTIHKVLPTNKVVASVQTRGHTCAGLVTGFGAVWVANCDESTIVRIDPRRMRVTDKITVPGLPRGPLGKMAKGLGALWTPISMDGQYGIAQIDPKTLAVDQTIAIGKEAAGIAVGLRAVWVTNPYEGILYRVDPDAGEITATLEGLSTPRHLIPGPGAVWVLNEGDGTVVRVDAASMEIEATVDAGDTGPSGDITYGDDLWVRQKGALAARIDDAADELREVVGRDLGPGGLHLAFGSLWASDIDGQRVLRLEI